MRWLRLLALVASCNSYNEYETSLVRIYHEDLFSGCMENMSIMQCSKLWE